MIFAFVLGIHSYMRSIFFALVAINIVAFIVQLFIGSSEPMQAKAPPPQRVSGGAALQLLEEVAGGSGLNEKSRRAVASVSSANANMCTMVGPYAQLLHAEYLVERLAAMDVTAVVKSIEVPDSVGYWVYLPPEMSEKEAWRRLHEIQAKNIDSYIIPSGELANGISFGMFNDRGTAQARLEEIRMQGYRADLREVERTHNETWVTLGPGEAEKIDATVWVDLLNQQPGLEKRQNFCQGVAPG